MKLIKVNVLKEWIENWFTKNQAYHPYAKNNNIPITELYDILEQMPTAQPEPYGVCMDCLMKNVCRFKIGLGDYGYCSQWKGAEHG